jgi:hypothetical protein
MDPVAKTLGKVAGNPLRDTCSAKSVPTRMLPFSPFLPRYTVYSGSDSDKVLTSLDIAPRVAR